MFNYNENSFVSLDKLATHFNLPDSYLKKLADKGLIPSLDVNGHRRFNPAAVEKALERLGVCVKYLRQRRKQDLASERKKEKVKMKSQQGRRYRNRKIQTAFIDAVATILAIIGCFLNSQSNKQGASPQKNVLISSEAETKGNQSPAVVTSGPNSPVNIYISPSQ